MSVLPPQLTVYTDGASRANPGPSACAYVVIGADDTVLAARTLYLGSKLTNNMAEYRGMALALTHLAEMTAHTDGHAIRNINIYSDSKLVVEQINGNWKVKDAYLKVICSECQQLVSMLRSRGHDVALLWIAREQNSRADQLCNQALDTALLKAVTPL